jgi:DNA polymerase-1
MLFEPEERPLLLVIDGTALAFRAFFAIRGLTDSENRPSGALYGYVAALLRALEDHPAKSVVVAWDRGEPTFRHKMEESYKANREDLDEDLRVQFPWMREVTELMGIPSLDQSGFEADDIIASLGVQASAEGWAVRMFTSDKDLAQVVSEHVSQCPPPKQSAEAVILGPADIEEKYGLPPTKMAEWQALVGDSSDNIKGMPGVGPKRATTLLQKYEGLDDVLARGPAEEKGKLAENLAEYADSARLALKLVTMITDMDVPTALELKPTTADFTAVQDFCKDHSLNTLAKRFAGFAKDGGLPGFVDKKAAAAAASAAKSAADKASASGDTTDETAPANQGHADGSLFGGGPSLFDGEVSTTTAPAEEDSPAARAGAAMAAGNYRLVKTTEDLVELHDGLKHSGGFAFDTETTSIDAMRAKLVGMSFSWENGKAWYVAENLQPPALGPDGESAVEYLRAILEDSQIPKYGQNLKYDAHIMRRHGVPMQGWEFDTMIAHCLVDPIAAHNLDAMSLNMLGLEKIPTKALLGTGKKALTMDLVPVDAVAEYACEDADATFQLVAPLRQGLKNAGAEKLFHEVEMPLVGVLERMEAEGMRVDRERLAEMRITLGKRQLELERKVHELAEEPFNLNSPKQLGPILFDKLKIQEEAGVKRVGRTKTGYKTDAATMEKYEGIAIVDALLEYRKITKLIGTYVDALPTYIHPETGRIHSSFNQAVASTGRLSSSNPNLQNIPIRSDAGREIRRTFIPREDGWVLLSADYSQVELRVVAHLSQDPALISAFRDGADVHARTAALVFGVEADEVDPEMRSRAKAINFGILYGMGAQRLARETGFSYKEAQEFIDQYFEALPGVRKWLDKTLDDARETGEVRTLLGRHRPADGVNSSDGRVRSAAENVAVNTPVQGSAADLIKVAMLRVEARILREELQARMILQVHDELVFDCPESEVEQLSKLVREEMESAFPLDVPLKVDLDSGPDWASAH